MNDNVTPPWFGPALPTFPRIEEALRVTGPADSRGVYPAALEQQVAPNLVLRDRIPVRVWEPNGISIPAGFVVVGVLASSDLATGLPLYVTSEACCALRAFSSVSASFGASSLSGLSQPPSGVSSPSSVSAPSLLSPSPSSPSALSPSAASPASSAPGSLLSSPASVPSAPSALPSSAPSSLSSLLSSSPSSVLPSSPSSIVPSSALSSQSSHSSTVGPCCGCAAAPRRWTFAVSGITTTPGSGCVGGCESYNGAWILKFTTDPAVCHTDKITSDCCWATDETNVCGQGGIPNWILGCDATTWWLWTSPIVTIPVVYFSAPKSGWNCLGNNTMSVISPGPDCSGWPATITMSPVF